MADLENRYDDNVAGEFYVDDQCIDCDLCRETATDNFTRNEDGGYSYVYKQPTTPEERALCEEAMEGCPVEAIGNNCKDVLFFPLAGLETVLPPGWCRFFMEFWFVRH